MKLQLSFAEVKAASDKDRATTAFYGHYANQPALVSTGGFCWCKM